MRKDVNLPADQMSDDELYEMFSAVDISGDGTIDFMEFIELLGGDSEQAKHQQRQKVNLLFSCVLAVLSFLSV